MPPRPSGPPSRSRFGRRALLGLLPGLAQPAAATTAPPAAPVPAAPVPAALVVAVYGDSMAQGVGFMLRQHLLRDPRLRIVNRSRPATALGQPAQLDWIEEVRGSIRQDRPAMAVLMFGGNDRLPMRGPDGRWIPFASEAWAVRYRRRLHAMLDELVAAEVALLWLGYPIARAAGYSRDMAFLNALYREAVEARGGTYIDTWPWFTDAEGRYVEDGPVAGGAIRRLRTEDGIHMTGAGYGLIARHLIPLLVGQVEAARAPAQGADSGAE